MTYTKRYLNVLVKNPNLVTNCIMLAKLGLVSIAKIIWPGIKELCQIKICRALSCGGGSVPKLVVLYLVLSTTPEKYIR